MKSLIVNESHQLQLVDDIPIPEPGDYEALVQVACCMICNGTDLEILRGHVREASQYPLMLGHEGAGYVVKTGRKVRSFHIGDLVVRPQLAPVGRYYSGWGGFSEYGLVTDYSAAMQDGMPALERYQGGMTQQVCDPRMTPLQASFLITMKETYSALNRIGIAASDHVGIIGDGPVGLCMVAGCRLRGCKSVMIIGNRLSSLARAKELGADAVWWAKDSAQMQLVKENYGGVIDCCIDTVGSQDTILQGRSLLREDGAVAVYGLRTGEYLDLPLNGVRNFALKFVQWPILACESAVHDEVSAAILDGKIPVDRFVSHVYPLDEYESAFMKVVEKQALKVALTMSCYNKESIQ